MVLCCIRNWGQGSEVPRRKHEGLVQIKTLAEKAAVMSKTDEVLWTN